MGEPGQDRQKRGASALVVWGDKAGSSLGLVDFMRELANVDPPTFSPNVSQKVNQWTRPGCCSCGSSKEKMNVGDGAGTWGKLSTRPGRSRSSMLYSLTISSRVRAQLAMVALIGCRTFTL